MTSKNNNSGSKYTTQTPTVNNTSIALEILDKCVKDNREEINRLNKQSFTNNQSSTTTNIANSNLICQPTIIVPKVNQSQVENTSSKKRTISSAGCAQIKTIAENFEKDGAELTISNLDAIWEAENIAEESKHSFVKIYGFTNFIKGLIINTKSIMKSTQY